MMMYEQVLEICNEFNALLYETLRLLPFLFCCVVSFAVLLGGVITLVERIVDKYKAVKNERK